MHSVWSTLQFLQNQIYKLKPATTREASCAAEPGEVSNVGEEVSPCLTYRWHLLVRSGNSEGLILYKDDNLRRSGANGLSISLFR